MENQESVETTEETNPVETIGDTTSSTKLLKALKSEREARKALESQIKTLESTITELSPYKARCEDQDKQEAVETIIANMTEKHGSMLIHKETRGVFDKERFQEAYLLIDKDETLFLEEKVTKAYHLTSTDVRKIMANQATPPKGSESLTEQISAKSRGPQPSSWLFPGRK